MNIYLYCLPCYKLSKFLPSRYSTSSEQSIYYIHMTSLTRTVKGCISIAARSIHALPSAGSEQSIYYIHMTSLTCPVKGCISIFIKSIRALPIEVDKCTYQLQIALEACPVKGGRDALVPRTPIFYRKVEDPKAARYHPAHRIDAVLAIVKQRNPQAPRFGSFPPVSAARVGHDHLVHEARELGKLQTAHHLYKHLHGDGRERGDSSRGYFTGILIATRNSLIFLHGDTNRALSVF